MISGRVFIATSLDGYIARENGDIEWLISRDDPAEDHGYDAFIKNIDGIIFGRGTYEAVIKMENWFYTKPVIVLSKSLKSEDIPAHLRDKVRVVDAAPQVAAQMMAKEGWKNVYVDGGQVIQSFLREGLITEMTITQVPVLLGKGRPLFGPLEKDISLRHMETVAFPSGLVQSKYSIDR